jgi:oligopeptide transport system substrate-binding protein
MRRIDAARGHKTNAANLLQRPLQPELMEMRVAPRKRAQGKGISMRSTVAGFAVGFVALMAAALPARAEELAESQVLHLGNFTEPATLDPEISEGVPDMNIEDDLYEGLVVLDKEARPAPGVAESWTVSPDGLTYTFKLRENAKWSNGEPVTADDFVWSWRRAVDPATGSKYSFLYYPIKNAEDIAGGTNKDPAALGVRAVDPHTFEVTLKAPTGYFLGMIAHHLFLPINRANVEKFGRQFTRPGNLVSNGAFMLKEWTPQSRLVVVKNPQYWDADRVKLTEIDFFPIENQNEELKRYRAGEVDVTYFIPPDQVDFIRQNMATELKISPYLGTYDYGFNLQRPPFKDNPKLRKAIALVIDRAAVTDQILKTGERPLYSWSPPGLPGYRQQPVSFVDMPMEQRIAEAKKLYQEAGYGPDKPLTVELRFNTSEINKKVAIAIASMLGKALGMKVTLANSEFKVFLEERKQKKVTEMFYEGWIGDYADPNTFAEVLQSEAGLNDEGYSNPEYDRLVKAASTTVDPEKRMQILQDAEKLMMEDMPMAPIYSWVQKHMVKPYVVGYEPNVLGYVYGKDMYLLKH